jgi:excisionase family DNA binding protein
MKSLKKLGKMEVLVGDTDDVLLFDKNQDDTPSLLLTISEVARLLKISPSGVRRLQQQRHIPFLKVGGSVRFLTEDILAYLREQRVEVIEY